MKLESIGKSRVMKFFDRVDKRVKKNRFIPVCKHGDVTYYVRQIQIEKSDDIWEMLYTEIDKTAVTLGMGSRNWLEKKDGNIGLRELYAPFAPDSIDEYKKYCQGEPEGTYLYEELKALGMIADER